MNPDTSQPPPRPVWLWAFVAAQLLLLAGLVFIDFGWRTPGQFGLRIGEQVLGALAFVPIWIVGIVWAIWRRAWRLLGIQVAVPLLLVVWKVVVPVLGFAGSIFPGFPLDPADHQGLAGATRAEVMEAIGDHSAGERVDQTGVRFLVFNGLHVYLADERRVSRIVASENPIPNATQPSLVAEDHQDLVGQDYIEAVRALSDRGGYGYSFVTDEAGTYQQFNGVRVYIEGEERVSRVVSSLP